MVQYKNKFNLSDEETKEYSKNYFKTIERANQYKPKKLQVLNLYL